MAQCFLLGGSQLVKYEIETTAALEEHARLSIAFNVASKMVAEPLNSPVGGWSLREVSVASPYVKDYDEGGPPTLRPYWDTSQWRIVSAFVADGRVGGAMVACRTAGSDFLEGREDIAAIWDIRVAPEWRGKGIGTGLFDTVVRYAKSIGCVELKIETQDVNVGACRFYAKQGCKLTDVIPEAYPDWPGETELIWRLTI
ncbi:MAG: GNAT family N-acetyltransferase [Chloroflexi bacterium]|nr:GNAT family N-acetyltransferase [Chloroflexota bacterium]